LSLMRLTTRMRQKHDMTTTDMNCTQTTLINSGLQQFVRDEQRPHGLRGTSGIYSPTFMSTSYFSRARLPYTCIFLAHSSGPHKCMILARGSGIPTIRSCRNESILYHSTVGGVRSSLIVVERIDFINSSSAQPSNETKT
jgi:hypothetical protein